MVEHIRDDLQMWIRARRRVRSYRLELQCVCISRPKRERQLGLEWLQPAPVAMYTVYLATFVTNCGTLRSYVGKTRRMDVREACLQVAPPGFGKCKRSGADHNVRSLETNLGSNAVVLAVAALHAARAIAKSPDTARGGPWASKSSLSAAALEDAREVAKCRSLMAVVTVAERRKESALWRHLQDLRFQRPADASSSVSAVRGACVTVRKKSGPSGPSGPSGRSGPSGTPGNQRRRNLVRHGVLKEGSAKHTRLHRGREPTARRRLETARRKNRN